MSEVTAEESDEVSLAVLKTNVRELLRWREKFVDDLYRKLEKIQDSITKEWAGRPSWGVAIILTLLSSALVGCATALFMGK